MIHVHASLTVFVFLGVLVRTCACYIIWLPGVPLRECRYCMAVAARSLHEGRCCRVAAAGPLRGGAAGGPLREGSCGLREGRYGMAAASWSLRESTCYMAVAAWPRAAGCRAATCKAVGSRAGGCGLQRGGVEAVKAHLHNRMVEDVFYLLLLYE